MGPVLLRNEFAAVAAEATAGRGGTCLRLVDTKTGVSGVLDPIVLEALAWASREELEAFTLGVLSRTTRFSPDESPDLEPAAPASP